MSKYILESIIYCPKSKERLRILESLKVIRVSCGYIWSIRIEDKIEKGETGNKRENQ